MNCLPLIPLIFFVSSYITDYSNSEIYTEKLNSFNELEYDFKEDLLESIMEFANDSLSIEDLYIPGWLLIEDKVPFPTQD
jgi:hypothetical protein